LIDEGHRPSLTKVIAITSGKGGVGKTNIATNLAIALASLGERVCVFDADLGLANINILLGLSPEFDLQHVVFGNKEISDIMIDAPGGITIIPASSGVERLTDLNEQQREKLISSFGLLDKITDFLLVDTSGGISSNVLSFVIAAHETIVVLSPEPTSLTDGYALIKVLISRGYKNPIRIVINMVTSPRIAQALFQRFDSVVKGKLSVKLNYLGYILQDKELTKAVSHQKPIYLFNPKSNASRCFFTLAENITNRSHEHPPEGDVRHFWKQALAFIKSPILDKSKDREDIIYPMSERFEMFKKEFTIELQNTEYSEDHMLQIFQLLSETYKKRFNKSIVQIM
jgi:MinD-like ATPase involved in chromosome partitioning or flagellar assembly